MLDALSSVASLSAVGATPVSDEFLSGLLKRLQDRFGGTQALLFGAGGEPFWAAHPITQEELRVLEDALKLIESLEADHPKPFVGHDGRRRFVVAALDTVEDLYVVVFREGADRLAAEARVVAFRDELRVYAETIRARCVS